MPRYSHGYKFDKNWELTFSTQTVFETHARGLFKQAKHLSVGIQRLRGTRGGGCPPATAHHQFLEVPLILWTPTPKLLGMQKAGATPVDFYNQKGIYLLYDGREVIYVGRSEHSLGKRLYEHVFQTLVLASCGRGYLSEQGGYDYFTNFYKSEERHLYCVGIGIF